MHEAVLRQRMQGAGLGFTRLQPLQRLGHWHLVHDDLAFSKWRLRDAVAGLDQRGLRRAGGGLHAGRALEEAADVDRVDGVVRTLVNEVLRTSSGPMTAAVT